MCNSFSALDFFWRSLIAYGWCLLFDALFVLHFSSAMLSSINVFNFLKMHSRKICQKILENVCIIKVDFFLNLISYLLFDCYFQNFLFFVLSERETPNLTPITGVLGSILAPCNSLCTWHIKCKCTAPHMHVYSPGTQTLNRNYKINLCDA